MRKLTRSRRMFGGSALGAALLLSGCAPVDPVGVQREKIYDGTIEREAPAVVLVADSSGICTGTLIGPRLVLTAKHCVHGEGDATIDPDTVSVYVGPSSSEVDEVLSVREIRVAPGTWNVTDGTDIAILLLSETTSVTPIEVSFEEPIELEAQTVTLIGYGLDENDEAGLKRRLETTVLDVYGPHVYLPRGACAGDSGGPLLGEDGRVWAVTSHGPRDCNFGSTYVSVHGFRDLIEDAMLDSRECTPGEESCNGMDDDCDGEADEGCVALGGSCSADDECAGERCATTPAGRICSQECDPLSPRSGCPGGFYCAHLGGCERRVRTHAGSARRLRQPRLRERQSRRHRLVPGRLGLRVAPVPRRSGRLAPVRVRVHRQRRNVSLWRGMRRGGERVRRVHPGERRDRTAGARRALLQQRRLRVEQLPHQRRVLVLHELLRERSRVRLGVPLRGRPLSPRPARGYGRAVRERRGLPLRRALRDARQLPALRVELRRRNLSSGYGCTSVDGEPMCIPDRRIVGETCSINEDCHTGLCAHAANGSVCTRFCGPESPCGAGFECIRIGDGTSGACIAPSIAAYDDSTCSAAAPGSKRSAWWIAALVALNLVRRRRPRR